MTRILIYIQAFLKGHHKDIALGAGIAFVVMTLGLRFFVFSAAAAPLTLIQDTLSNSDVGVVATNTIQYTNSTSTNANETIRITFDPVTDLFDGVQSITTSTVAVTGFTVVDSCSAGADRVTLSTSSAVEDESLIFTVCPSNTVASGTKVITIMSTAGLTNPTSTGSYIVRIAGTQTNAGDTRVGILNHVVLTASVDTSFSFTVVGVATGTSINGVTTTKASTATTLNFGTLPTNMPVTLGQLLTVTTNAVGGFSVSLRENGNPVADNGADIDLFVNGNATGTPSAWVAPSSQVGSEATYGHIGITTNDADLGGGSFNGSLFVGDFQATSSRIIFSATSSADGTTQNIGAASVAYRIQIGILQEAAASYTNTFQYIATPVF